MPDAKTVWLFRETLKQQGMGVLFKRFDEQLAAKGLVAKGGQFSVGGNRRSSTSRLNISNPILNPKHSIQWVYNP